MCLLRIRGSFLGRPSFTCLSKLSSVSLLGRPLSTLCFMWWVLTPSSCDTFPPALVVSTISVLSKLPPSSQWWATVSHCAVILTCVFRSPRLG